MYNLKKKCAPMDVAPRTRGHGCAILVGEREHASRPPEAAKVGAGASGGEGRCPSTPAKELGGADNKGKSVSLDRASR